MASLRRIRSGVSQTSTGAAPTHKRARPGACYSTRVHQHSKLSQYTNVTRSLPPDSVASPINTTAPTALFLADPVRTQILGLDIARTYQTELQTHHVAFAPSGQSFDQTRTFATSPSHKTLVVCWLWAPAAQCTRMSADHVARATFS